MPATPGRGLGPPVTYEGRLKDNLDLLSSRGMLLFRRGRETLDAEFSWDTTLVADGPHTLRLVARDGLSEAVGPRGAEYGEDRLRDFWCRHGVLPPGECIARLMADLEAFRGATPQSDDVTLVVLGAPAP